MSASLDRSSQSRTSRHHHYVPRSTLRSPEVILAGKPDHPFAGPVRDLCAEIEHLKRENRALLVRLQAIQP